MAEASEPLLAGIRESVYQRRRREQRRSCESSPAGSARAPASSGRPPWRSSTCSSRRTSTHCSPRAGSRPERGSGPPTAFGRDPRDPGEPRAGRISGTGSRSRSTPASTGSSFATPRGPGSRPSTAARRPRARSSTAGWATSTPRARRRAIDRLRRQLDGIAALGGRGVITPAAWGMFTRRLPPLRSRRALRSRIATCSSRDWRSSASMRRLRAWCCCLEPLNRYEDHMVNSVAPRPPSWRRGGVARRARCSPTPTT